MVRDRGPVPLDVVALRRQIPTDAVGDLAPWSVGKQAIHAGERPVRLARVVLRVDTLDGRSRRDVVARSNGARRLDLADQETGQPRHQPVGAVVTGRVAPLDQPGEQERGSADRRLAIRRRGCGPLVALDQSSLGPLKTALGNVEGVVDAVPRRHVEAHDRTGVADHVVVVGDGVCRRLVEVQPGAVGVLVAGEPGDDLARRVTQPVGRDVRAALRR